MNKYILIFSILCCSLVISSCSREKYIDPMADNGDTPNPVTQVSYRPLPGAAVIRYKLPANENLRYVKAVYSIRPGVEREVISSLYKDSLIVDGLPSIQEYEVKLYTVSYGEKVSTPVSIKVTPLTSPLQEAYSSFQFEETFGGTTVTFNNSGEASLAITLLTPDSSGKLSEVETYYTKSLTGRHSVRGFQSEPRLFGAVIRDRWGNLSDTLTQMITPIFEELIPKNLFKEILLPTDVGRGGHGSSAWTIDKMWDGLTGSSSPFHTSPVTGVPQWFTIDMGRLCLLSRYKFFHRGPGADFAYKLGAPSKWEVWGSANTPDPSGSWAGWTKLMDCVSYKPSGEGPVTAEDINYAVNLGEDFTFPDQIPVRYLRFKINETWGFQSYVYINELTFWGDADITP